MKRMLLGLAWIGGGSLLGFACGGNVIVDAPGGGGADGSGSPASNTTTGTFGQGGASMVTVGPGPGPGPATISVTSVTSVGPAQVVSSSTGGTLCDNTGDCSACQSCAVEGPCAAQWDQCVTDPSCSSMLACFNACNNGDQMCYSECYNKFPDAQQLYEVLALCVLCDACYVDCNGLGSGC